MAGDVIMHVHPDDGQDWQAQCARCGSSMDWQECENCDGEGLSGHDCGEDCCCCADPEEPNVPCGICGGHGGWNRCLSAPEWCQAHPMPGREDIESGLPEWYVASPAPSDEGRPGDA